MTATGWEFQPHGGPYSLETLVEKFPQFARDPAALEVRRKCIESPIYLASTLLSCMWRRNLFDRPSEAHRLVEKAMIEQRDTLYVDARGTAKTTLSCEIRSVWQLLKYPNDSGLLTHSTDANAIGLSLAVRTHFCLNKTLLGFFPEYEMKDRAEEGNIKKWSVPCRQLGGQQESIECATSGTATAGRHYDWICSSDWMNEQTTPLNGQATVEKMNGIVANFAQVRAMLQKRSVNPRAYWAVDSNRWYMGDLADTILSNDKADTVVKVIRGVTGEPGNFRSSWPEVQTPEEIQQAWDDPGMNPRTFAANYRSAPQKETGYAFKRDWFHDFGKGSFCVRCQETHEEPDSFRISILLDPAFSDSKTDAKKTDRSAVVVVGISPERRLYLLYSAAGRGWDETEITRRLFALMDVYKPQSVGIEDTSGAKSIIRIFNNEALMTGRFVPYRKIEPGGRSKDARIAPLHHIAQQWGIFVHPGEHNELIEEAVGYGSMQHDDLLDALAYAAEDIWSDGVVKSEKPKRPRIVPSSRDDSADGFLKRIHDHARRGEPAWKRRTA